MDTTLTAPGLLIDAPAARLPSGADPSWRRSLERRTAVPASELDQPFDIALFVDHTGAEVIVKSVTFRTLAEPIRVYTKLRKAALP